MIASKISDYFDGVAAKYLSAVDADTERSNQHEIGGLVQVGFKEYLGTPGKTEEFRFKVRQIYIDDAVEQPLICDADVTWYDSRRKNPYRSPEYRLYYYDSVVTERICAGDFLLIAKLKTSLTGPPNLGLHSGNTQLVMIFAPNGSLIEQQLRAVFGLQNVDASFKKGDLGSHQLLLPIRLMLESLGIELSRVELSDSEWLTKLLDQFGGQVFPATEHFSEFARKSLATDVAVSSDPDKTLLAWMEHEERLFRLYERHIVLKRLRQGFGDDNSNVDDFMTFSLSVQNRRKARVGLAFEGHLRCIFSAHKLQFEQGRGKDKVTENNSRPDFLFPSFASYHDEAFHRSALFMLGAKTTCKDRWRQVLAEAKKIETKHLATLEPGISKKQIVEMRSNGLHLVVPEGVHWTYAGSERSSLLTLAEFISLVSKSQSR